MQPLPDFHHLPDDAQPRDHHDDGLTPHTFKVFVRIARRCGDGVVLLLSRRYVDPTTGFGWRTAFMPTAVYGEYVDAHGTSLVRDRAVEIVFGAHNVVADIDAVPPLFVPGWTQSPYGREVLARRLART